MFALQASAADVYVGPSAAGSGNGSDWINRQACLPTAFVRNTTYWLADGDYSSCGGRSINTAVSGTQRITIKKATVAEHGTSTGWSDTLGDGEALWMTNGQAFTLSTSYVTIDGSKRDSVNSGHGIVLRKSSPNTETTFGFIRLNANSNQVEIKYIEFDGVSATAPPADGSCNFIYSASGSTGAFVTIRYNYFHDICQAAMVIRGWSDMLFEHNYLDTNRSTSGSHGNCISDHAGKRMTYRYNIFKDFTRGTGCIDHLGYSPNDAEDWYIYGNVFDGPGAGNGAVMCKETASCTGFRIYNNTFVNMNLSGVSGVTLKGPTSNNIAYNNLFYNNDQPARLSGIQTANYNTYLNTRTPPALGANDVSNQSASSPFVNFAGKDFRLAAATTAGFGLLSPHNTDLDGSTRGADGIWDRGAYEFGFSSSPSSVLYPPRNLTLTIQ